MADERAGALNGTVLAGLAAVFFTGALAGWADGRLDAAMDFFDAGEDFDGMVGFESQVVPTRQARPYSPANRP